MSDNASDFDKLVAALDGEQPARNPEATRAQPSRKAQKPRQRATRKAKGAEPRPKREAGQSEQRGPRADPAYVQINANVRQTLKASLFYYLKVEKRTLSSVVEELLEQWIDERGGEFVPPKPKREG